MLLQKSMKNLVSVRKINQLRLWGKIKGTNSDYYITEGKLDWTEDE